VVADDQDTGRETPKAKRSRLASILSLDEFAQLSPDERELILWAIDVVGQKLQLQIDSMDDRLQAIESKSTSETPQKNEVVLRARGIKARGTITAIIWLLFMLACAGVAWRWHP